MILSDKIRQQANTDCKSIMDLGILRLLKNKKRNRLPHKEYIKNIFIIVITENLSIYLKNDE